jgi:DNA invertase Pin-like site-specific DNA recombinase
MTRPALQSLLAEVETGRVDVVVVYKVDRLTRSLTDFARIVEAFDRKGVSFVSVTQSFNTTTSMGRLTLNVLLSFAQFEREVTSERIRDKISASKAKGIFMGGNPALGYDIGNRKLVVNPAEADLVRHIFRRYLELGTVNALRLELECSGVTSKTWTSASGRAIGGQPLSRGALFHLLKNRLFVGEVIHKGVAYPGEHEAILDRELFDAVQAKLAINAANRASDQNRKSLAPLRGLVFDEDGRSMSPSFGVGKQGKTFRYYVSAPISKGASRRPDAVHRVSAPQLEALVAERLSRLQRRADGQVLPGSVVRVDIGAYAVTLTIRSSEIVERYPSLSRAVEELARLLPEEDQLSGDDEALKLAIDVRPVFRGGRTWLVNNIGAQASGSPALDRRLVAGLRQAHAWLVEHDASPLASSQVLRSAKGIDGSYARKIALLAFLAPDIQKAILTGRQPAGLSFTKFLAEGMPLAWADQRKRFGFSHKAVLNSH